MELRCGCEVADDRPRPTRPLTITPSGLLKIGRRGYDLDDAQSVFDRDPLWKWQPASDQLNEFGTIRRVPARWLLVGRGPGGQILGVVIDLPGLSGQSDVVTVFEASPRLQSEYDDWVRRGV